MGYLRVLRSECSPMAAKTWTRVVRSECQETGVTVSSNLAVRKQSDEGVASAYWSQTKSKEKMILRFRKSHPNLASLLLREKAHAIRGSEIACDTMGPVVR